MILIRNLNQINHQLPKTVITIGNFDGVHLAHQEIINTTKNIAKKNNLKSAIISFEPHPNLFFHKNNNNFDKNFRINNLANKIKIIKKHNPDFLIIIPFNQQFCSVSARDFINQILINKINAHSIILGHDFRFGKDREGNIDFFKQFKFDIHQIEPIKFSNQNNDKDIISSSLIRNYIKSGNVDFLPHILGKNFSLDGVVVEGKKLAQKIGYKTANTKIKSNVIYPKFGVYKTRTFIPKLNQDFASISNFGIKPTIDNTSLKPILETHILDFCGDIYGQKIIIEFQKFIRDEKKFNNLDELKNQIAFDIKSAYANSMLF